MKAQQKSSPKAAKSPRMPRGNDEGGRYVDRDLMKVNPLKEQFEPTDAEPVNLHKRMAGAC